MPEVRRLVGTNGVPVHLAGGGTISGRTANADMPVMVGGADSWVDPSAIKVCSEVTKKGEPCKAAPTESGLCVGHGRAAILRG